MQIRPIVVHEVADEMGIDGKNPIRLLSNQDWNIRVGVHYLASLIKKFRGDLRKALMAYNQGPPVIARLYRGRNVPLLGYQGKVLRTYANYTNS